MKYIFYVTSLLVANFLFLSDISAQQTFVNGYVTDSLSGESLIGVVITSSQDAGTVTDVNGFYQLKAKAGVATLTFTYTGYATKTVDVTVSGDSSVALNVQMKDLSKELNIVVVSSGRYEQKIGEVPVSMEVIKPAMIEHKNTTNINQIIDQTPGVNVTDDQCNIRGGSGYSYGSGSRVLLVVDDMPLLSGDAGDVKWNYLPIENVSQIEVMKGAASALFGSSALNGVIHFRTAYPTSTPQTSITFFNGFYNIPTNPWRDNNDLDVGISRKWWGNRDPTFHGVNFSHSRQIGNFDLVLGGHIYNDEGYRYLEDEDRIRFNVNTRYRFKKVDGLSAGINFNMMRTRGGLFILWYDDSLAYIPSDSTIQHYENYRWNIDPYIVYQGPKGHHHALRTRLFVTDNNNDTEQGSNASFYYGEYQYQFRFKNDMSVTAGLVGTHTNVESDLYGDRTANNIASYAQFDRKFFKKLFVTVGARFEYFKMDTATTEYNLAWKKNDTLTLPFRPVMRVGVNYQAGKATYIRVSYGQGYRFPCVAEKYIRTSAAGLEIYPNDSLQPEYGQSAEIGVKQGVSFGKWKGYADAALFWMEYTDMMEFTFGRYGTSPNPFENFGFKSINIGKTRITGVDISVIGEGNMGPLNVALVAGYTYMNPVSLTFDPAVDTLIGTSNENILKYRYRHIAKFDAEVGYKRVTLGMNMRYNSFMENIDEVFNTVIPGVADYRAKYNKGDLIFDAHIMFQLTKEARLSLITNNVFNRECTSRPADVLAPRNFTVQMVVKF